MGCSSMKKEEGCVCTRTLELINRCAYLISITLRLGSLGQHKYALEILSR